MMNLQPLAGITAVLQRLPAALDEQSLLRIHVDGVARRDVEEQGIERGKVGQEAAPFAVALAMRHCLIRIGLIKSIQLPAVAGHLTDAVLARSQILPELLEVLRARI